VLLLLLLLRALLSLSSVVRLLLAESAAALPPIRSDSCSGGIHIEFYVASEVLWEIPRGDS
jgi:hypothetical protein